MRELKKSAGERCKHQSFAKGCKVYGKPAMPGSCRLWSCRWLVQRSETAALSRPDRSGYVVDIMPDFITAVDNETGQPTHIEVVQVWVDPLRPDAHRDPALRDYLSTLAEKGIAALIRYDAKRAFVLAAPCSTGGRDWLELPTNSSGVDHSAADLIAALGPELKITVEEGL